jgi:hypothetical protein
LHRAQVFSSSSSSLTHSLSPRANPTDNPDNLSGFSASSRSLAKGAHGIGDVVLEPLQDVWRDDPARINNSMDNGTESLPGQRVVERALEVVHGEDRQAYTPYNVVTNNCEHFAHWCRNGWSISSQVPLVHWSCPLTWSPGGQEV